LPGHWIASKTSNINEKDANGDSVASITTYDSMGGDRTEQLQNLALLGSHMYIINYAKCIMICKYRTVFGLVDVYSIGISLST